MKIPGVPQPGAEQTSGLPTVRQQQLCHSEQDDRGTKFNSWFRHTHFNIKVHASGKQPQACSLAASSIFLFQKNFLQNHKPVHLQADYTPLPSTLVLTKSSEA